MTFDNFELHPKLLKAVAGAGYSEPTMIQLKAIPKILKGFDVRASAQTGTGKTAAFLLPTLNRLTSPAPSGKGPRILILAPTRELAMQIAGQAEKYSQHMDRTKTVCISGGIPYHKQTPKLSRPYDVLIATPGRLIDFLNQGIINLNRVEMLILDEADRMLDMGFLEPVEEIVAKTPKGRQTLLFSATLQGSVLKFSERLLEKPMDIVVHAEHAKHENIKQRLHYVDDLHHKNRLLNHILRQDDLESAIVFTATKRHADLLVRQLRDEGHEALALHGDMSQRQRTRTIEQLRRGKVNVLVATDVAARGIDVQSITHVINFDLPRNIEDYVHRIGRTGRAGATGTAISFSSGQEAPLVKRIEAFTGQTIEVSVIEGFEPTRKQRSAGGPSSTKRPYSNKNAKGGWAGKRPNGAGKGPKNGKRPFKGRANSQKKGTSGRKGRQF